MTAKKSSNPWPIAITAYFIVFFLSLVIFVVYATTQHVDLVRADYYEQEIRFQQQFERVDRTRKLTEGAAVAYEARDQRITIRLPAAHARPTQGQIHLYRPSDAALDQQLPLLVDDQGVQRLDSRNLRSGLWKVRVQWTVAGQEYYVDQPVVISSPHTAS